MTNDYMYNNLMIYGIEIKTRPYRLDLMIRHYIYIYRDSPCENVIPLLTFFPPILSSFVLSSPLMRYLVQPVLAFGRSDWKRGNPNIYI